MRWLNVSVPSPSEPSNGTEVSTTVSRRRLLLGGPLLFLVGGRGGGGLAIALRLYRAVGTGGPMVVGMVGR